MHILLVSVTLALVPLQLPAYIVMWLLKLSHYDCLDIGEKYRIDLMQGVISSCRRIVAGRGERSKARA